MANINFRFLADSTQLQKATKNSKNSLNSMEGAAKKLGSALKGAFAVAGIGFGIDALASGLKDISKAAIDDNKSQQILARTMRQVANANSIQIAQAEAFIDKMQTQTAILDDDLRPAYSTLLVATKSQTKAQELLTLATNVSAGTGKDLTTVSAALGKAYNGQLTSLNKLIPGISKANDPMKELAKTYNGMAQTAAENDPLARMAVVFADLQEELGRKFLPIIEDVAAFLSGPEGDRMIDDFIDGFGLVVDLARDAANAIRTIWDTFALSPADRAYNNYLKMKEDYLRIQEEISDNQRALIEEKQAFYAQDQALAEQTYGTSSSGSVTNIFASAATAIREAGLKFRDAIDLSAGLNETQDKFDISKVMPGVQKMVAAAKRLPALLNRLRAGGADQGLLTQIMNMGPVAGAATASGLLSSGQLGAFVKARNQLSTFGQQAGLAAGTVGATTYAININKANMTAEEIIAAIQAYEKKTGKKVALNG